MDEREVVIDSSNYEEPEEEKEEEKKSFWDWTKEHGTAIFWIRFTLWTLCACVLPFIFIVWRFELFKPISKIRVGGWGIIAFIIVGMFLITIIKYVRKAMSAEYSLTAQILTGFCKVTIPLCVLLVLVYGVRNNVSLFLKVMGVVTILETVAIPINPLPKWAYERQKDVRVEERKGTFDYLIDEYFKRKKEEEEGKE